MPRRERLELYRFYGSVGFCVSSPEVPTFYLTAKQAASLAPCLEALARDIDSELFGDSKVGPFSIGEDGDVTGTLAPTECQHESYEVVHDEACAEEYEEIRWCRRCGAIYIESNWGNRYRNTGWRRPVAPVTEQEARYCDRKREADVVVAAARRSICRD